MPATWLFVSFDYNQGRTRSRTATNTLYVHGLTHLWDLARLPIQLSDEAGEASLRVAKRFARNKHQSYSLLFYHPTLVYYSLDKITILPFCNLLLDYDFQYEARAVQH